jgi:hypothetical protein
VVEENGGCRLPFALFAAMAHRLVGVVHVSIRCFHLDKGLERHILVPALNLAAGADANIVIVPESFRSRFIGRKGVGVQAA